MLKYDSRNQNNNKVYRSVSALLFVNSFFFIIIIIIFIYYYSTYIFAYALSVQAENCIGTGMRLAEAQCAVRKQTKPDTLHRVHNESAQIIALNSCYTQQQHNICLLLADNDGTRVWLCVWCMARVYLSLAKCSTLPTHTIDACTIHFCTMRIASVYSGWNYVIAPMRVCVRRTEPHT